MEAGRVGQVTVLAAVLVAVVAPERVDGQEPPPDPATGATDAAACLVEPRPAEEIVAIVGTAVPGERADPGSDLPAATPAPGVPPGTPADDETFAAVEVTIHELAACLAAGEFARAYALYTDAFLLRSVGPLGEEELAILAGVGFPGVDGAPSPPPEVVEVRLLADGRAFALVIVPGNDGSAPRERGFLLVRAGGRWLVDEAADVDRRDSPDP